MAYCFECGAEIKQGQQFCSECGADITTEESSHSGSFIDRYGAKPLFPFAGSRYNTQYEFAKIVSKLPIIRSFLSFFVKLNFLSLGIIAKFFSIVTLNSHLSKRLNAEIEFAKDNYKAGMEDTERPPNPP
jgi:hypothetical protein